jgi:hypothetical protein
LPHSWNRTGVPAVPRSSTLASGTVVERSVKLNTVRISRPSSIDSSTPIGL